MDPPLTPATAADAAKKKSKGRKASSTSSSSSRKAAKAAAAAAAAATASSAAARRMPADATAVEELLKSMGIESWEPRVVHQCLELMDRHASEVLEEAQQLSKLAGRPEISPADVRVAIEGSKMHKEPAPLDLFLRSAEVLNSVPLPAISGPGSRRLPPPSQTLLRDVTDLVDKDYEHDEEDVTAVPAGGDGRGVVSMEEDVDDVFASPVTAASAVGRGGLQNRRIAERQIEVRLSVGAAAPSSSAAAAAAAAVTSVPDEPDLLTF
eukprot:PLAT12502.17.p1 GENE.PLAT12502.17~~PLAT12502.17.p1  ORF type:complete len:266 (+),score=98.48 PLAT12502.17:680-1477(+)